MATRYAFVAVLLIMGIHDCLGACGNLTSFSTQMDTLLAEYDRNNPPSVPVLVAVRLDIRFVTIVEPEATVRMLANLHMSWADPRLSWNVSDLDCGGTQVSSERLWLPDVALLSAAIRSVSDDLGLRAHLSSDGTVSWVTRLDITAPINMDLSAWPTDKHEAVFKFSSRFHSVDEIELVANESKAATVFASNSWHTYQLTRSTEMRQDGEVQQTILIWAVRMRRRGGAHALAAKLVLATATLLLVVAATLPPLSRPGVCAAAAFTSALWLISSAGRVSASPKVPLVLSLVSVQCVCACLCALSAAAVRLVARCSSPPPPMLRALVTATSLHCRLTPTQSGAGESSLWAAAAALLDRALLALLVLTSTTALAIGVTI